MKLGIISAIYDGFTFEEAVENAVQNGCAKKGIEISSLAFYPNTMDGDLQKREANIAHLKKVINMSALLGVNMVTTFIGRDQTKTVEENLELFKEIWPPIIKLAEENFIVYNRRVIAQTNAFFLRLLLICVILK